MDTLTFNVKDRSAEVFFKKTLGIETIPERIMRDFNPYYYMKDELFIQKSFGLEKGQTVVFYLDDSTRGSEKKLSNKYTYEVTEYDDLQFKLVLIDFQVTLT